MSVTIQSRLRHFPLPPSSPASPTSLIPNCNPNAGVVLVVAMVATMVAVAIADAGVKQHHVRPKSRKRQHIRGPGCDAERAARVVPASPGAREEDAPRSTSPSPGEDSFIDVLLSYLMSHHPVQPMFAMPPSCSPASYHPTPHTHTCKHTFQFHIYPNP